MIEQDIERKLQRALRPIQMTDAQRARHRDALLSSAAADAGFLNRRSLAEFGVIALVVIVIVGGIAWWQRAPSPEDESVSLGVAGPTSTPTSTPSPTPTPTPTATPTATPTPTPPPTPTLEAVPAFPPSTCPVTRPGQDSHIPPEPYPASPPDLYNAVWYGSDVLWTMISPDGEIWTGLPYHADSGDTPVLVQKTFWWRDFYQPVDEPRPDILVTGRRLDKPGATLSAGSPGTNGIRADIGSFMLVGIEIPTPGCWEITGHYEGATLSYVVWVGTPGQ